MFVSTGSRTEAFSPREVSMVDDTYYMCVEVMEVDLIM